MEEIPFKSDAEVVRYVESQARLVLLADWRLERLEAERLGWRIVLPGQNLNDYLLHVSADRSDFVFLHGNTDAGPLDLDQLLLNAKVLDIKALQWLPLSRFIEHVLRTCEPNRWGLT